MQTSAVRASETNRAAFRLFLVTALFWFTQYTFASYLNPELERMGASSTMMGLVGGAYGLFQLLSRVPLGLLSARAGRQKLFVCLGCALSLTVCVGMYVFYTPAGFLVFRALAGAASGTWVCFTVLYGSYFSDAPRHISLLDMGGQVGKLVCYLILLWLAAAYGCRAALVLGMASGVLALFMSYKVRDARFPSKKLHLSDFLNVARDKWLLCCALLASLAQFIQCGTYLSFTQNLATRLNATNAQLTVLNIALIVPTVLLNLLATKVLLPKIGVKATVCTGFVMGGLYCVLAPRCASMPALYLCQILAGGNTAVALSTLLGQSMRNIPPENRSLAMSLFQTLFSVGMMLGPVCVGALADAFGLSAAFLCVAGVCAAACALAVPLLNKTKTKPGA